MSELSILELETEHVELLPEREALGAIAWQIGLVNINQNAAAVAAFGGINVAKATNVAVVYL